MAKKVEPAAAKVLVHNPRHSTLTDAFKTEFCIYVQGKAGRRKPGVQCEDYAAGQDVNIPLFVICHNYSRLGTDIDLVVEDLTNLDIDVSLIAVVVVHVLEKHSLPLTMPTDNLTGEAYTTYGLLVDCAFSMEKGTFDFGPSFKGIYKCEMNNTAHKKIEQFLLKVSQPETRSITTIVQQPMPTAHSGSASAGDPSSIGPTAQDTNSALNESQTRQSDCENNVGFPSFTKCTKCLNRDDLIEFISLNNQAMASLVQEIDRKFSTLIDRIALLEQAVGRIEGEEYKKETLSQTKNKQEDPSRMVRTPVKLGHYC